MWIRADLKTKAKEVLKLSYWKAFVVSLVLFFVGADSGRGGSGSSGGRSGNNTLDYMEQSRVNIDSDFIMVVAIYVIAFILLRIMIGYALEVGGRRFFMQAARMDINMGYLGYAFKSDRYKGIILTMLYRGVLNFLWFLLFIIPGIIKSYAYSMVPYILADNPNIGYNRAIELSNNMTKGQKFDMFILDLSFIGWYLLGSLLFFVGIFFVLPYENATKAELYLVLRQNALDNGYSSPEELLI